MVRAISRLRYRRPPVPISFKCIDATDPRFDTFLAQRAAAYVVRQSNPRHIRLRTVVDLRAKQQPNERPRSVEKNGVDSNAKAGTRISRRSIKTPPPAPFTLKRVVDPDGKTLHGQVIYIFRHVKTNQIIYSLQELLDQHHLRQLSFMGKHSKPPTLRPDHWSPHCLVSFPTPEQGHNAYRKLREFRKLHELAWSKNHPRHKKMALKKRMETIMNQRANMSADLAAILRIQETQGKVMLKALRRYEQNRRIYLKQRWQVIAGVEKEDGGDTTGDGVDSKEKKVTWLRKQIRLQNSKLKSKEFDNEEDQKRLKATKQDFQMRLKKVTIVNRRIQEKKEFEDLSIHKNVLAKEEGVDTRLDKLKKQVQKLESSIDNPDPNLSEEKLAKDKRRLVLRREEIVAIEKSLEIQAQERQNLKRRSILPHALKKVPPTPYTLEGVSVQWRDMKDALYASKKWPDNIEHQALELHKWRDESVLLSSEEFDVQADEEINNVLVGLRTNLISQSTAEEHEVREEEVEEEPERRTGLFKYLPRIRFPWSSATA